VSETICAGGILPDDAIAADTPEDVRELYRGYAAEAKTRNFGLLEEDVVVLDTETTGLSFKNCELIEIAAVRLNGREIVDEFQTFVKPKKPIPGEITELTGISDADVYGAPDARQAVAELAEFVGGAPVIAHNATFDRSFIERVPGGSDVSDVWIDSLALSRIALPRLKSHALSDLARWFGCEGVSHRAMDDVYALAGVWRVILTGLSHLPAGLLAELASAQEDVYWAYRPIFKHLALEAGDVSFSLPDVRKELLKGVPSHPREDVEDLESAPKPVTREEIEQVFSNEGPLSKLYDGYELRAEQLAMAQYVAHALNQSKDLAIEAGTGVGKSMAYLVPMALYANRNQITCGIATKTNALTDQLMSHELPILEKAFGKPLTYCALKGYDHYPCLRKALRVLHGQLPLDQVDCGNKSENTVAQDMLTAAAVTLANACQETEGDIDSLGIRWRNVPRSMLTTTPQECERMKCPFYPDKCLLHGARRRAQAADIVVTNHSLLLRDVAAEGRILPPIRSWVVDEAHGFEDEARRQWALTVSAAEAQSAFEALGGSRTGAIRSAIAAVTGRGDATLMLGLLTKASTETARAQVVSADFFDALKEVANRFKRPSAYDSQSIWISDEIRNSPEWADMAGKGVDFARVLGSCVKALKEASDTMHQAMGSSANELDDPLGKLEALKDALTLIVAGDDPSYVYSIQSTTTRYRQGTESLVAEKIDIGAELARDWYPDMHSVIYASATMSVAGDFSHFNHAVGFDLLPSGTYADVHLDSSYDFDEHMAAIVVGDLPDPRSEAYLAALEDMLYDVHVEMGGSVLTLFTNRREMETVYANLAPRLRAAGLELVQQERQSNVRHLRERFVKDKELSLFALKSFWEGFDASGDTLRCVVIPKLPFSNPNEPLSQERELRDRRAWWNHSLPDSVLAVKQAAGRLIRSSTDTGVLVLADSRLTTKRYGKVFIDTLPTRNVSGLSSQHVGKFIKSWRKSHK
jgi:ATP-dependent DNA helicase DinG